MHYLTDADLDTILHSLSLAESELTRDQIPTARPRIEGVRGRVQAEIRQRHEMRLDTKYPQPERAR